MKRDQWTGLLTKYEKLMRSCLRIVCVGLDPIAEAGIEEAISLLGSGTVEKRSAPEDIKREDRERAGLVLVDVWNSGSSGLAGLYKLRAGRPAVPVVVYTRRVDKTGFLQALAVGADGYLIQPLSLWELLDAFNLFANGHSMLCGRSQDFLLAAFRQNKCNGHYGLSFQERRVVGCVLAHKSNKEISVELGIAEGTVHTHLTRIFSKLEVPNRDAAGRKYLGLD